MLSRFILTILIVCSFLSSVGQAIDLKGTITSTKGDTIPFASVLIKNKRTGVSADMHGQYSINVVPGRDILVFSATGYVAREILVTSANPLHITLEPVVFEQGNGIPPMPPVHRPNREIKVIPKEVTKKELKKIEKKKRKEARKLKRQEN